MHQRELRFVMNNGWVIESDKEIDKFHPDNMVPDLDPEMAKFHTKAGDFWFLQSNIISFQSVGKNGASSYNIVYCNENKLFVQSDVLYGLPELPYSIETDNGTIEISKGKISVL